MVKACQAKFGTDHAFRAPVLKSPRFVEVWLPTGFEGRTDAGQQGGVVVLDGEQLVGTALLDLLPGQDQEPRVIGDQVQAIVQNGEQLPAQLLDLV